MSWTFNHHIWGRIGWYNRGSGGLIGGIVGTISLSSSRFLPSGGIVDTSFSSSSRFSGSSGIIDDSILVSHCLRCEYGCRRGPGTEGCFCNNVYGGFKGDGDVVVVVAVDDDGDDDIVVDDTVLIDGDDDDSATTADDVVATFCSE
ncbi:hypothetical protein EYC80_010421 [Monilinia laxa]|uniref:Uncharacterized protein n=1 Tax=Monilinia laxa TaxID=61186 RepID=A0A5N6JR01_MONLA|nr:hypothetical protein EYC80_010421 [Monilinia laxa]